MEAPESDMKEAKEIGKIFNTVQNRDGETIVDAYAKPVNNIYVKAMPR